MTMSHLRPTKVVRAAVAALVLVTSAALIAPTSATAIAPAATSNTGLFGSADPTYDGVYRQSIAILGLKAVNAPVPPTAITWLTGQQCADGSFMSYRADTSQPCAAPDPANFTGPDSNSTAVAAMALREVGRTTAAGRAVTVLRAKQNSDGGWGYTLGSPSDANSTGLSLAALRGAGTKGAPLTRALAFLKSVQVSCTAPVATRFALMYQAGQAANALASVQGLVGIAGTLPVAATPPASIRGTGCRDPFGQQVSAYVARTITANKGAIPSAFTEGATDWNATATGVIGLVSAGYGRAAVVTGTNALSHNAATYTGTGATYNPGASGTLLLVAGATGQPPRAFGPARVNLVTPLLASITK